MGKIFRLFLDAPYDVVSIQETHATEDIAESFKKEWKGQSIWNNNKGNSGGTAALIKHYKNIEGINYNCQMSGRVTNIIINI